MRVETHRCLGGHITAAVRERFFCLRLGNGPERTGEGWFYRGRDPLQENGKVNYARAGETLGIDLVADQVYRCRRHRGNQVLRH
jgi:predicted chitinase